MTNDLAAPGLIGGLVLIVMLIGFTIMQSAFAAAAACALGGADAERRALAMTGCGDAIFDWNVGADQIYVSAEVESQLGLRRGALEGPAAGWLDILHPLDRDRYSAALDGVLQQRSGRINHDIRLRGADSRYHSFVLKARPVVNAEGEVVRVIGALADVTETKAAEERILHDAIHDNLTGLPNRELFFDRLEAALIQAQRPGAPTPAALAIDIDGFKADQRRARHVVRRFRAADGGAPARPRAQARRHAGAHGRRPVRRHRAARRRRRAGRRLRRVAARADGDARSASATARSR